MRKKRSNVDVRFAHKLLHVDPSGVAHFESDKDKFKSISTYNDYDVGSLQIKPRLIVGADGAYSSVRESLLRLGPTNFERHYITHGYKELTIPPTADGEFAMKDHESLHIWPRGQFMMIGLPNPDKSFTCTIFAPFDSTADGIPGLNDQKTPEQIQSYFREHFADAMPIMPTLVEDWQRNPACGLVTTKVFPWNWKDRIVLLGDSAHAVVPFYGQGMNAAFEDVLFLDEVVSRCEGDLSRPSRALLRSASQQATPSQSSP